VHIRMKLFNCCLVIFPSKTGKLKSPGVSPLRRTSLSHCGMIRKLVCFSHQKGWRERLKRHSPFPYFDYPFPPPLLLPRLSLSSAFLNTSIVPRVKRLSPSEPSPCPSHYSKALGYYVASALFPARWHSRVPFG
jgi:hypothetical protein